MMFDTSTQHGFAPLGMPGHQSGPYGQQFGQSPVPGFVPIIGLVPQSLIVNLVTQCLQQAQLPGFPQQIAGSPLAGLTPQSLFGPVTGQLGLSPPFGLPQLGLPQQFGQPQHGQPQSWPSPWQATGGWAGQPQYSGAVGRGILTYAG